MSDFPRPIELPPLEKTCPSCNGSGRREPSGMCFGCDGLGVRLTTAGEKLLSFVQRWLPAEDDDA